jgi:ribonuclease HI
MNKLDQASHRMENARAVLSSLKQRRKPKSDPVMDGFGRVVRMKPRSLIDIYVDGGIIGSNPSKIGGTWAAALVKRDKLIKLRSGVVLPEHVGLPVVTNNVTELLAAIFGLEMAPAGWDGTLFTDSQVTACRLSKVKSGAKGLTAGLLERLGKAKARAGRFRAWLLAGHPSKAELEEGHDAKGRDVSRFNVLCDEECSRLAREFMRG